MGFEIDELRVWMVGEHVPQGVAYVEVQQVVDGAVVGRGCELVLESVQAVALAHGAVECCLG